MIPIEKINKSWTLFLDRDGVINYEKSNDYIHTWEEFKFYEGVLDAMKTFHERFQYIFVVTNQRGVGKGLTKLDELHRIHAEMESAILKAGGKIDAIYYCSDMDNDSPFRKPNPGMGLEAKKHFPDIDFSKSIMIGNTMSDMEFGKNLGVYTVFLPTTRPEVDLNDLRIDLVCDSLKSFANMLIL